MKITKIARFLLIAVAAVMVFALFACGETPKENETTTEEVKESVESTGDKTPDEPENTESSDVAGGETTESKAPETAETEPKETEPKETEPKETEPKETEPKETETTEAPACDHAETEVDAGKAATCTENGLTEGSHCTLCGAVVVAQDVIPAAHTLTAVEGKAATCTDDGIVAHNHCSVCEKNFDAEGNELDTVVIPAAHTPETVAGKAATCTEDGLTEGKKCSVCETELVAQQTIPATNHANKTDKAFMAPTTAEDGWEAHIVCPDCGKVWDAKGEELEAVPTIEKIVPTTEKYFGFEELKGKKVNGVAGSLFSVKPSADRTYVRFQRDGQSDDGNIMLLDGNTEATGQYFVMKYRTDHRTNFQLWANTKANDAGGGSANFYPTSAADAKWHIIVLDLSKSLSTYVVTGADGKYTIQWSRIDMLDGAASEGYFDIAFAAYCDDLSEISSVLFDGDEEFCTHIVSENPEFTNCGENHSAECILCGGNKYYDHSISGVPTWNVETKKYSGTCTCGCKVESDMLFVSEAYYASGVNGVTATRNDAEGVTRYTIKSAKDAFFHVYAEGSAVTGKYAIVKYRAVNGGNNATFGNVFAGSVMDPDGHSFATNGDDQNSGLGTIYADGEWHYAVVTANSKHFVANADGTYSYKFLRLGVHEGSMATDGSAYIEVDWVAFADNKYAVDLYIYGEDAVCAHEKVDKEFNSDKDVLVVTCLHCGHVTETVCSHSVLSAATWDSDAKVYKATCADCGKIVTKDVIYRSEANSNGTVGSSGNFVDATTVTENGETFVRYTPNGITPKDNDTYFMPWADHTSAVTGQFMIIKYRITNNGKNMTISSPFAGSAANSAGGATGQNGDGKNTYGTGTTLYADGEWHYFIITPNLEENLVFTKNADGTYTWKWARIRFNGFDSLDGSCYIDIEEIAFTDNSEAASYYVYKNDTTGKSFRYVVNLDNSNVTLDKVSFMGATAKTDTEAVELDMSDKILTTPTSFAIGGWVCVDGGVKAYKMRVTSVDGVAVENPELVHFTVASDRNDIYGANKSYYLDNCAAGAGMNKINVDLTAWAGHKVDFEIVVSTNFGEEFVAVRATNVTVPALYSEPEVPTYVHLSNIGGTIKAVTYSDAFEDNTALTTSTSADYLGRIYISGRVAIAGTAQKLVYRLLDANGNQIQEWKELDFYSTKNYTMTDVTEGTAHLGTAQKEVPEVTNVYEYVGMANITAFPGQTVTVECALVLDGVEGEDAYYTFMTFKNVTNTQSAS